MARNPEEVLAAAEALAREAEEFAAELMTTVEKASANFKRRASALRSLAVTNALASIGDGAPSVEEAPSVEGALQVGRCPPVARRRDGQHRRPLTQPRMRVARCTVA